jgi:hypothetical protein
MFMLSKDNEDILICMKNQEYNSDEETLPCKTFF